MASPLRDLMATVAMFCRAPFAIRPRDIQLFVQSGRTDAAILADSDRLGSRGAFEAAYAASADPWRSASPRHRYQRRKYASLMALLPRGRRYDRVLDIGSGLGLLSRLLAPHAGHVLGLDLAQTAVDRAKLASAGVANVEFRQGDAAALPNDLGAAFDLIVVVDTLYYMPVCSNAALDAVVARIATLLAASGTVLLANHYFTRWGGDSKLSRRIHDRFILSPAFELVAERRRPFYLASLLRATAVADPVKGGAIAIPY